MKLSNTSSGIGISSLLHCVFVVFLLAMAHFVPKTENAMVIDFTITTSKPGPIVTETRKEITQPQSVATPPTPMPPPEKIIRQVRKKLYRIKSIEPKMEKPVPQKIEVAEEKTLQPKPEETVAAVVEQEEVRPEVIAEEEINAAADQQRMDASEPQPVVNEAFAGGGAAGTADTVQQDPKTRYIKAHFEYIKNEIQQRIIYPLVARKKGWQGRVTVSFVVCEDGRVEDIHVKESSGFPLLDNCAIKTIQQAAPFPAPPCRAELVVPISYSLV